MRPLTQHQMRETALHEIEARLANDAAGDIELRFARARLLTELGRTEEAKAAYLAILHTAPDHFGTLNNLGTLLYATGYISAALTVYRETVKRHPDHPDGHVNLANALLANDDIEPAKTHYEQAIALKADHAEAHQGLARALAELGDETAADRHRRLGFEGHAVKTLPYRGEGEAIPLLLLVSAIGGNIPLQHFLDDRVFETTVIVTEFYDLSQPLPPHRLIVNAIGDAEICGPALHKAEQLLAQTAAPVINPPAAILPTGRIDNARRLAALPGVIAPRMVALPKDLFAAMDTLPNLAAQGFALPFLLRAPGFHTGLHFYRVANPEDLAEALTHLPGATVTLIQDLDARSADGKYRKYRVMAIGGKLYPLHLAVSKDWKVHYFTADMVENPAHRAEDEAFLKDMAAAIGQRAVEALHKIVETLALDYGGIDFGLSAAGDVLLFEANATMIVLPPPPGQQWDYRRPAYEAIAGAVRDLFVGTANL
jgi:hypothetical protein